MGDSILGVSTARRSMLGDTGSTFSPGGRFIAGSLARAVGRAAAACGFRDMSSFNGCLTGAAAGTGVTAAATKAARRLTVARRAPDWRDWSGSRSLRLRQLQIGGAPQWREREHLCLAPAVGARQRVYLQQCPLGEVSYFSPQRFADV